MDQSADIAIRKYGRQSAGQDADLDRLWHEADPFDGSGQEAALFGRIQVGPPLRKISCTRDEVHASVHVSGPRLQGIEQPGWAREELA